MREPTTRRSRGNVSTYVKVLDPRRVPVAIMRLPRRRHAMNVLRGIFNRKFKAVQRMIVTTTNSQKKEAVPVVLQNRTRTIGRHSTRSPQNRLIGHLVTTPHNFTVTFYATGRCQYKALQVRLSRVSADTHGLTIPKIPRSYYLFSAITKGRTAIVHNN